MARHHVLLPLVIALSATITACGSATTTAPTSSSSLTPSGSASSTPSDTASDTSTSATAAKASLKSSLLSSLASQTPPIPYDDAGAQCVADNVVDHLGMAKLAQLGLNHESGATMSLSTADATYLATELVDCAPNNSIVEFFIQRMNDGMGAKATDTQKSCMDKVITRELSIQLLSSEYDGQAAAGQASFRNLLTSAAPGCGLS